MFAGFTGMLDAEEEQDKLIAIYEQCYGTMVRVAKSIITDHALAEDAVSDAIITIIENLHNINDVSCHKTRAYIVIIIKSRAINLFNKQKKRAEKTIEDFKLVDNCTPILDSITTKESYNSIITHIKALSKPLADVLYLSVVSEYSTKEVSDLLNISRDVVRQRLSRGRAQVGIALAHERYECEKKC